MENDQDFSSNKGKESPLPISYNLSSHAHQAKTTNAGITEKLLAIALSKGISDPHGFKFLTTQNTEGNTADSVILTETKVRHVVKLQDNKSIVSEALYLDSLKNRTDLPKNFHTHFPLVYSISKDKPPYGYIMQAFEMESLAQYLFGSGINKKQAEDSLKSVLNVLLPAYITSQNELASPNVADLYLTRIESRIKQARQANSLFRRLSADRLEINGKFYEPPEHYINRIYSNIERFRIKFTTFVHGDSHAENILFNFRPNQKPIIKFIDMKDWHSGDYMFDIGKLAHYLSVTGLVEKVAVPPNLEIDENSPSLKYNLNADHYFVNDLLKLLYKKMRGLSERLRDYTWKDRFNLSMASNLLGTPFARLKTNDPRKINAAFILYAEGLKYLSLCN